MIKSAILSALAAALVLSAQVNASPIDAEDVISPIDSLIPAEDSSSLSDSGILVFSLSAITNQ